MLCLIKTSLQQLVSTVTIITIEYVLIFISSFIGFSKLVSFQNTTFQYLASLVSDNKLPGAYFIHSIKGLY